MNSSLKNTLLQITFLLTSSLLSFSFYQSKAETTQVALLSPPIAHSKNNDILIDELTVPKKTTALLILICSQTIVLLIFSFFILKNQRKQTNLKQSYLNQLEPKIPADQLPKEIKELTLILLNLARVNEIAYSIKNELDTILKTDQNLKKNRFKTVYTILNHQIKSNYWKVFYNRFDELQENYLKKVINKHPNLTPSEIQLCALLRLNLTTKDIANLTNRSPRTIENIRYRLKRKMKISTDITLTEYLFSI